MLDGAKVKKACDEHRLTGEALARLLHVSTTTISKIKNDHYPGISLMLAKRVAWALRKHLCELMKDEHGHDPHGEGSTPH